MFTECLNKHMLILAMNNMVSKTCKWKYLYVLVVLLVPITFWFYGLSMDFIDYYYHPDACQRISDVAKKNNPSISVSAIQQPPQGRLGNQLSNFASGYALWRDFGILNYMDPEQLKIIGNVFKLPTYEENDDNARYYVWLKG